VEFTTTKIIKEKKVTENKSTHQKEETFLAVKRGLMFNNKKLRGYYSLNSNSLPELSVLLYAILETLIPGSSFSLFT
jgi:hypothetical protein